MPTLNPIPVSSRTLPMQSVFAAGGGFTLPQYSFVPGANTRITGNGHISSPTIRMTGPALVALSGPAVPLIGAATVGRATGIRIQFPGSG